MPGVPQTALQTNKQQHYSSKKEMELWGSVVVKEKPLLQQVHDKAFTAALLCAALLNKVGLKT